MGLQEWHVFTVFGRHVDSEAQRVIVKEIGIP